MKMAVKKKRQRKNKKWIPWKQLTPEEREQLRRESDKKSFRKLLKETKERATAAENSGNYLEMIHAPRPTNEVVVSPRRVRTRIIRTTTRKRDTWISGMFTTWWKTMTRKRTSVRTTLWALEWRNDDIGVGGADTLCES